MEIEHNKFIELAIEEAKKSTEPLKCGVVIVKNGGVLVLTHNSQRKDSNAIAHAEIKAIAEAGKMLGSKNLVGCDVYCSCEPCTMCLTAMIFAKVEKVYFKDYLADVSENVIKINSQDLINKSYRKIELVKI